MGLVPGAGGTVEHIDGGSVADRAAWLALTGATVDAGTARAWGLIDGCSSTRRPRRDAGGGPAAARLSSGQAPVSGPHAGLRRMR